MKLGQRKSLKKQSRNDWIWSVRDHMTIYEIAEEIKRTEPNPKEQITPSHVASIIRQRRSREEHKEHPSHV